MKKRILPIIVGILLLGIIYNFYTTFSLEDTYSFKSDVYEIEDGMIKNISPNTELDVFISYFTLENCTITIKDKNNNNITNGIITNNSKTILTSQNQVIASYTNIIEGDITEDGKINEEDFTEFGKFLIEHTTISKETDISLNIDKTNGIHLNDLMLLEKAVKEGINEVTLSKEETTLQTNEKERIVATITPNYGVNRNLVWKSQDENIAIVNKGGEITGKNLGTTTITATTPDGKIQKEVRVIIDNTIKLSSYKGNVYQEGNDLIVAIKSIDYNGITCTSSREEFVTCRIENNNLYLTAGDTGTSIITVTSPNYGSKTFTATSMSTYINIQYTDYDCVKPYQRPKNGIFVSSMNAGTLSFEISDTDIIEYAYTEGNQFRIKAGSKTGRGIVTIKGSNSNVTKEFTLDVYQLSIPAIGGVGYVGEELSTEITAAGTGELTCTSPDETTATCRIENNTLYVTPLKTGQITISVNNTNDYKGQKKSCGTATFLTVIRER